MKCLILILVSLFCLMALSDHKKDPVSEEERTRYYELKQRRFFLNEKETLEFEQLKKKVSENNNKIWKHFNKYMHFERKLLEAQKGDPYYQSSMFHIVFPYSIDMYTKKMMPDCTKERLEKNECPEIPYTAIYWAKKHFESGYCVWMSSSKLMTLMGSYVIPKTDMKDSEDFFRLLRYIAFYFYYQTRVFESESYYKKIEREAKIKLKELIPARFSLDPETSTYYKIKEEELIEPDPNFVGPKRSACMREKTCLSNKKRKDKRLNLLKNREMELKNKLNEKQKKIADKMISDLLKKWTEKYGKDKIYECRDDSVEKTEYRSEKEFLDKYYPYH